MLNTLHGELYHSHAAYACA